MSSAVNESVECGSCGFVFQGDEVGEHPREHEPCPNCGSLRRHIRVSVKETWSWNEYNKIKAKEASTTHKKHKVRHEFEEGKRIGKDGKLVYKKRVINREHPDLSGSYVEVVKDKDGKPIVNKSEKLSEHRQA